MSAEPIKDSWPGNELNTPPKPETVPNDSSQPPELQPLLVGDDKAKIRTAG